MRKRRKKSKNYFTQETEDAIVRYSASDDIKERTELYVEYIGPALNEMVDKIIFTYKFTSELHVNLNHCIFQNTCYIL